MDDMSIRGNDEKKKFLRRYQNSLSCLKRLEAKLVSLDERLTTIKSPNCSGMPRGGVPVTIDDLLSDKEDLEGRIKRLKVKSRELRATICEAIDSIENSRYCEILEAHYIDGLSIEEIAEDIGYSERHVYTIYDNAINAFSIPVQ